MTVLWEKEKVTTSKHEEEALIFRTTYHKYGVNTVNFCLILSHGMITHVAHDGEETVKSQSVEFVGRKFEQRGSYRSL